MLSLAVRSKIKEIMKSDTAIRQTVRDHHITIMSELLVELSSQGAITIEVSDIAQKCNTSNKSVRTLLDKITDIGLVTKYHMFVISEKERGRISDTKSYYKLIPTMLLYSRAKDVGLPIINQYDVETLKALNEDALINWKSSKTKI